MHQFLIRFLCFSLFLTICCSFYKSIRASFRTFVNVVVSCMRVSFSKVVTTKVNLFLVFMCILLYLNFFCPFLALPGDHYLQYPCSIIIIIIKIISIHNIHCYQQHHHNHHHHCHQHHKQTRIVGFFRSVEGMKEVLRNTRLHLKLKQYFYYSWCLFIVYDWIMCQKQSPHGSVKKGALENYAKFTGNTCARVSFLMKLKASGLQLY